MAHVEFAVLLLALLWLMWMVAFYRYSDLGRLEREVDDVKENQAYALEVLRIALTEIIGVDKTATVIESRVTTLKPLQPKTKAFSVSANHNPRSGRKPTPEPTGGRQEDRQFRQSC